MWRVALGIVVCLQAGALRAGEGEGDEKTAAPPSCPGHATSNGASGNEASGIGADEDCPTDEVVPAAPVAAPHAAPATVSATTPSRSAFATVTFRNDVGSKLRLVEAHFTMDGADLPTVLTEAPRTDSTRSR